MAAKYKESVQKIHSSLALTDRYSDSKLTVTDFICFNVCLTFGATQTPKKQLRTEWMGQENRMLVAQVKHLEDKLKQSNVGFSNPCSAIFQLHLDKFLLWTRNGQA